MDNRNPQHTTEEKGSGGGLLVVLLLCVALGLCVCLVAADTIMLWYLGFF